MLRLEAWSFLGVDINELRAFVASGAIRLDAERRQLDEELEAALSAYRNGDQPLAIKTVESAARACAFAGLVPIARTGRKVRAPFAEANEDRTRTAADLTEDWQARADNKWAQPQHKDKSARAIAALIAMDGENPETIRKRIKKKLA